MKYSRNLLVILMVSAFAVPEAPAQGRDEYHFQCKGADGRVVYKDPCPPGYQRQMVIGPDPRLASAAGSSVVKVKVSGNHYSGTGTINGVAFPMVIDTGATKVSMSMAAAQQAGINLSQGRRGVLSTANGPVPALHTVASSVSFAGQTAYNVEVVVQLNSAPAPMILVGMSYLKHFEVSMNDGILTLARR